MRSGTLNIPGIAGMGKAASEAYEDFDNKVKKVAEIKDYIISELENTEGVSINSQRGLLSAPHVLSVTVKGIRGEVLLHALEAEGIYVASGSACSSNHPGISGTLKGIGLTDEAAASTIRLSFSEYNTMHEADYFLERLNEMLPVLRRFK